MFDRNPDAPIYYKEFAEGRVWGFRYHFNKEIFYEAMRSGMVITFKHLGDAFKWLQDPKCIAVAKHELCRIMLKHNHWIGHEPE